jgi:hypothetical protein
MRPKPTQLTTAGSSQVGPTTKYTRTQGAATSIADVSSGQVAVQATVPGAAVSSADMAAHLAALSSFGAYDAASHGSLVDRARPTSTRLPG